MRGARDRVRPVESTRTAVSDGLDRREHTLGTGGFRSNVSRFSPENLVHNLQLVALVKQWAERKRAAPSQIALAWLLAQKPFIVPIPGTTVTAHMVENTGAADVRFTSGEITELNTAVRAIEIKGQRLPDGIIGLSGLEAPAKK